MDLPEPPLTLREKYLSDRARADLKMAQNRERRDRQTLWQGTILPGLIWLVFCFGGCLIAAYFILWPMRDTSLNNRIAKETTPNPYGQANSQFYNGQLDSALKTLKEFMGENPGAPNGHILAARIHLAQGHPDFAIASLREARKTALNRTEIDEWIHGLSAAPPEAKSP